jgi:multidrug resistance efflux pump
MLNKRFVRIFIGLVLLILLIVSFVPNLYLKRSSDGIINAHTTTLKSPIEGVLKFVPSVDHGAFFSEGAELGKITNDRVDYSFLHELKTEHLTLESRIDALSKRIESLDVLESKLSGNLKHYHKYSATQIELMLKQTNDQLHYEKAENARARKEYEANKQLLERNAVRQREFETSESNYLKSEARIRELENRTLELNNTLAAIKSGVYLNAGQNDVPYSSQRLDQLVIEKSNSLIVLNEAQRRIRGIARQIEVESERLKKAECYTVKAPFDALVWRLPYSNGSSLAIGSEIIVLMDCSSIFLDIVVSEAQFSDIKPGDSLQYRLVGGSSYFSAQVVALRGSGTNLKDKNLAANLNKNSKREFHVWAMPAPGDLELKPDNFYQVGRRIEVKIPRRFNFKREISRFFNVF